MARLLTSGFDEVPDQAGLIESQWNTVVGTVTLTAPPAPRPNALSTQCAKFAASAQNFISRSLNPSLTSGKAYVRAYVLWSDFGGLSNAYGILWQWTNNGGTGNVAVKFNASTKHFQAVNIVTGATTTGTLTVALNKWYRVEMESTVSTTSTGTLTVKIYDGDNPDPTGLLETLTVATGATIASGNSFVACQMGNRSSTNWGTLYMDDVAINDDIDGGDGQTTWCGPGCSIVITPNGAGDQAQWAPTGVAQNWDAVDELPGVDPTDGTYNSTTSTTAFDNFTVDPLPSSLPEAALFTVYDVYARAGGNSTSTCDICLSVWDENNIQGNGPKLFISTTSFALSDSNEHYSQSIVGVTKTQLNSWKVGYQALNGTSLTKKVSAVWVQVEYQPDVSKTVSASMTSQYVASGRLASSRTSDFETLQKLSAVDTPNHESTGILIINHAICPHESLGTTQNIKQAIHRFESLRTVSQEL